MRTIGLLVLALAARQDDPIPGPADRKVEFEFRVEEHPEGWDFVVEGTADLPDGAILRGRAYVLDEIVDARGQRRLDDQMLGEPRLMTSLPVRDGKFRGVLHDVERKPYSLRYRARLVYQPDRQEPDVAAAVGEKEFAVLKDIRLGTDAEFRREVAETHQELARELTALFGHYQDLKRRFQGWLDRPDPAAYRAWYGELRENLDEFDARNRKRFNWWAVWIEYQGRLRIDSLIKRFGFLCRDFEAWQKEPQEAALQRIRFGLDAFLQAYEEDLEVLGIEQVADPETLARQLGEYEAAVRELRELGKAGAQGDRLREPRRKAQAALLTLASPRTLSRRKYGLVEELARLLPGMGHAPASVPEADWVRQEKILAELRALAEKR